MSKTVAILGMGPSIADFRKEIITEDRYEPLADEIWSINMSGFCYWTDRVFWMDDLKVQNENFPFCIRQLKQRDIPVVCPVECPELLPKSESYPLVDAYKLSLKHFGRAYFGNGVAFAIAYAMLNGVTRLKMYGCDFTYPDWTKGESGRACVEAWLMAFSADGGEVQIAPTSSLFDTCLPEGFYGYSPQPLIESEEGILAFPGWEIPAKKRELQSLISSGLQENAPRIRELMEEIGAYERARQEDELAQAKANQTERIKRSKEMANANWNVRDAASGDRDSGSEPDEGQCVRQDEAAPVAPPRGRLWRVVSEGLPEGRDDPGDEGSGECGCVSPGEDRGRAEVGDAPEPAEPRDVA